MKNIIKKKYYKSITSGPGQISLNLSLRMVLPINQNRTVRYPSSMAICVNNKRKTFQTFSIIRHPLGSVSRSSNFQRSKKLGTRTVEEGMCFVFR